jgi:hypothetical protein
VILLAWTANAFQDMRWYFGHRILYVERGSVILTSGDPAMTPRTGWQVTDIRDWPEYSIGSWPYVRLGNTTPYRVRHHVRLPFWLPLVLTLLPTAYLIWRDRRRIPPHCCQHCGYNLTGNVSGTCPECGEAV